jgi:hypothetical protein
MRSDGGTFTAWPALGLEEVSLPGQLNYERAVWGKPRGSRSDFRWLAATLSFGAGKRGDLPRELHLGTEDLPVAATHWRSLGDVHYALSCYPSRATDAAGRTSFLEKQVLEWRRPAGLPAALGALLLLPRAASLDDSVWWERHTGPRWSAEDDVTLSLASDEDAPAVPAGVADLEAAIARGIAGIAAQVSEPALAELYAALLAGERAIPLRWLERPLPAESVAALLLPLPRKLADGLSIAGWLPARRVPDTAELRRCWDLVLGGPALPPPGAAAPAHEQAEQALAMARALLAGNPSLLGGAAAAAPERASGGTEAPIELAMWGPSSSGKTALLAKLYIDCDAGDWEIFPTQSSLKFIQDMREHMRTRNAFPPATAAGLVEKIEYLFRHRRTGAAASLRMEDRAGAYSENLSDELKASLGRAAGLVLLFDPLSEGATLESQVWRTLEQVHIASRRGVRKDDRPIAVCVSKADVLIESPEDLRRAQEDPQGFVREHDRMGLRRALDRFCSNYRLFPVSAAGVRLHRGLVDFRVFYDEKLAPRICAGSQPLNLMQPFSWLLDQVTGG